MPEKPPIALLAAMREEHDELKRRLTDCDQAEVAGRPAWRGRLQGQPVVLAESGVGKVASSLMAALLIKSFDCRAVVVAGVAGGLDPQLSIGDVVIADRLIQHDYGHRTDLGLKHYRPGVPPLGESRDQIDFRLAPEVVRAISASVEALRLPSLPQDLFEDSTVKLPDPRIVIGTIVSGDQFINSEDVRAELFHMHGGAAVEMEGAAVAQAAELLGVPCVVVRSLSDLAGVESHLDFPKFLQATAPMAADVVSRIITVL